MKRHLIPNVALVIFHLVFIQIGAKFVFEIFFFDGERPGCQCIVRRLKRLSG